MRRRPKPIVIENQNDQRSQNTTPLTRPIAEKSLQDAPSPRTNNRRSPHRTPNSFVD